MLKIQTLTNYKTLINDREGESEHPDEQRFIVKCNEVFFSHLKVKKLHGNPCLCQLLGMT